jgi:hypothetical protein
LAPGIPHALWAKPLGGKFLSTTRAHRAARRELMFMRLRGAARRLLFEDFGLVNFQGCLKSES